MKTLLYLVALFSVVSSVAAQQSALSGHDGLHHGFQTASEPWIGGRPSTQGSTLLRPMSAQWLGSALEANQEVQPPETPTMRRSKKRTWAGAGLMGIGAALLVAAANTNCLSDDEIGEIPDFMQIETSSTCISSVTRNRTRTSWGSRTEIEYESSPKPEIMGLYGGVFFVSGALLATVWADVPVKVDARQDGIHLSKSFSW